MFQDFIIVHEGQDYIGVWEKFMPREEFDSVKSTVHEVSGTGAMILKKVLKTQIKY